MFHKRYQHDPYVLDLPEMTDVDRVQIHMDDLMLLSYLVSTFNTFGYKSPHSLHSIWVIILPGCSFLLETSMQTGASN